MEDARTMMMLMRVNGGVGVVQRRRRYDGGGKLTMTVEPSVLTFPRHNTGDWLCWLGLCQDRFRLDDSSGHSSVRVMVFVLGSDLRSVWVADCASQILVRKKFGFSLRVRVSGQASGLVNNSVNWSTTVKRGQLRTG
ncbi:hypothetical protein Hanom_Chr16g01432871 [Helianthus anomalus]